MNHDQLFKELLQGFLPEFVALTLPEQAALLDWSTCEFLNLEEFTDTPIGDRRTLDLLARVRTLRGEDELLLIHVEVEADPRRDFPGRMFDYYTLLRLRRRLPILPIAVYLKPGFGGITVGRYEERTLSVPVVQFQYHLIALPDLTSTDLPPDNPLAHVFWSFLRDRPQDPVELRLRAYRGIARTTGDPGRRALLVGFTDAYTKLTAAQVRELRTRAQQSEDPIVSLLVPDFVKEGRAEGLREAVRRVATARLGPLPADVDAAVARMAGAESLLAVLDALPAVESVDELRTRLAG
jgi:hypothetical protein